MAASTAGGKLRKAANDSLGNLKVFQLTLKMEVFMSESFYRAEQERAFVPSFSWKETYPCVRARPAVLPAPATSTALPCSVTADERMESVGITIL